MAQNDGEKRAALVTGASYGFGAAGAIALAKDGCDVAATDLAAADLAETVRAIEALGRKAVALELDVRDQASIERVIRDAVAAFGQLDVLVNNAGVPSHNKPAEEITREDWDGLMAINLTGVFFMSQAMGRYLLEAKRPGAIICLSSTHGIAALPGASAYSVSKAGVSHICRVLAAEWSRYGIRVNAIGPGATETKTRIPRLAIPEVRERMLARIPMGRFGNAEEMGAAIRYLASPEAAYITGQTLYLDGGLTVI